MSHQLVGGWTGSASVGAGVGGTSSLTTRGAFSWTTNEPLSPFNIYCVNACRILGCGEGYCLAGAASQGHILTSYRHIVYLKGYLICTSEVAGVDNEDAYGYVFFGY